MLSIKLDQELEKRLGDLAEKTGRSKAFFVQQAIADYLEDIEDYDLAVEVLKEPGRIYDRKEVKRELGL